MSEENRELRSKGILPALGVGAAVYFITGVVSLSTLGLVGVGAGVGYGVGSWIADKYQERQDEKLAKEQGASMAQLPWAIQVSLQNWQSFLASRAGGQQLTPPQVEALFQEYARVEPGHAQNVSSFVHSAGLNQGSGSASSSGGPHLVPVVAAEV
eukprot:TRINITY_DN75870_c0_g1_i1.p1 TRINITY_DN75870_c0_g1~~TRINITY_DN75870_c0_g1_i1.p1  ORF type:complete len:175 (+),score=27.20 TRINITY_DN75870_c0_g1_i1:63-527(+)